jgi:conjugal transfer pilus assembly protein TraI
MSALSVLLERIFSRIHRHFAPEQFVVPSSGTAKATAVARSKSELTDRDPLAPVSTIVARIKTTYGFDNAHFDTHVMEVLRGLAAYLHQLPATHNGEFLGSSGALRMSLEIGLYSLQAAEGRTFGDNDEIGPASYMKHRWRLATLLGGLFSELYRVFGRVQVFNDNGECWPVECLPLNSWLSETATKRYTIKWRNTAIDARALGVHIASQIIPYNVIAYLAQGNSVVVPQLFSCIASSNHPSEKNVINEIVRRTASAVLDRNMRGRAGQSSQEMSENPAVLIRESLGALLRSPDGLPNAPGGKVWYGQDGLFIQWPEAAAEIAAALPRSSQKHSLHNADALIEAMATAEIISLNLSSPTWQIQLPGGHSTFLAIRLASPLTFLQDLGLDIFPLKHPFLQCASEKSADEPMPPSRRTHGSKDFQSGDSADLLAGAENREGDDHTSQADQNSTLETALVSLRLDCTGIVNPVVREVMEGVIARVDSSFDTMRICVCDVGLFIALSEFESAFSDTSILVRGLTEARLLYLDPAEPHKKLRSINVGGSSAVGFVIPCSFFINWDSWLGRWEQCLPETP